MEYNYHEELHLLNQQSPYEMVPKIDLFLHKELVSINHEEHLVNLQFVFKN